MLPITAEKEKTGLFCKSARKLKIWKGIDPQKMFSRQHDIYLGIAEWETTVAGVSEFTIASRSSGMFRSSTHRTSDSAQTLLAKNLLIC